MTFNRKDIEHLRLIAAGNTNDDIAQKMHLGYYSIVQDRLQLREEFTIDTYDDDKVKSRISGRLHQTFMCRESAGRIKQTATLLRM